MRTFVAVFPPPEVRKALFRAARDLPASKAFRLIGQEKLHLTLKFLGNVAEDDLLGVEQALEPLRGRHEPFEVETSDFGAFPSARRARILWAGVGEGSGPLRVVAQSVDDLLEPAGFGREHRPYVAPPDPRPGAGPRGENRGHKRLSADASLFGIRRGSGGERAR